MATVEATFVTGPIDAATGALSSAAAELERAVRQPVALRRVGRLLNPIAPALLTLVDVWLFFAVGIARQTAQRLALRINQTTFDGDEGLAVLKKIASCCGDLVQQLDGSYEQRRRLGRHWKLSLLNGVVLHQLEKLICEVEDIGETAALSASPEVTNGIMEQLAAHGIA